MRNGITGYSQGIGESHGSDAPFFNYTLVPTDVGGNKEINDESENSWLYGEREELMDDKESDIQGFK